MKDILKYIQLYTGCDEHTLKRIKFMLEEKMPKQVVVEKQVEIVERFVNKRDRPFKKLEDWAMAYFQDNNVTYDDIAKQSRKSEVVRARTHFCKEAYQKGYGVSEIGRYLKRDHTTILHNVHHNKTK